ncbi:hypothetical protein HanIR_Chr04g0187951 [Helianthus annuus]|nr:hypothetical protein HanIR_Chr04g0187951 [Helianthus annuus]
MLLFIQSIFITIFIKFNLVHSIIGPYFCSDPVNTCPADCCDEL